MNFEEYAAKPLLAARGIAVPRGALAETAERAAEIAASLGAVAVKAQVPAGGRGKAGAVRLAATPEEARAHAAAILGMQIAGRRVERVLVEERVAPARELYAAVLDDAAYRSPLALFSAEGGIAIEELAARAPEKLRREVVDIRKGLAPARAAALVAGLGLGSAEPEVAAALVRLYEAYVAYDAELVEVNPLAIARDGRVIALDCKLAIDDCALPRQGAIAPHGAPERLTGLEARARAAGLKFIELEGDVGVLANGAGLTMTTMDVVQHFGGRPADFLEIGGEAYTLARPALELLLAKPGIRSLVINFCGAFARTDVMAQGVIEAIETLRPQLPIFFSVHGTGEEEAVRLLRERLGVTPLATMEQACEAAVRAAAAAR